ncbi:penicillin binding protein transpeptidase domain-containing protein [Niabella sp. W65]|nr:penicillin binding protein transpeptidase domain-containing protein [Niabella sp. W65]MCH7365140.1 penicillin binding protein transpeptidase domain-containing protein [Niabella sp. W65]
MKQLLKLLPAFTALLFAAINNYGQLSPSASGNLSTETVVVRPDFKRYFTECQVDGSVVIYDNTQKQWIVSDTTFINTGSLPASAFKIINLLIFLETQTIPDENYIVKWPGQTDTIKYGYRPDIYHDITVKKAFELSAGWAFIELAQKIDRKVYRDYLVRSGYGNADVSFDEADFWNFGPLGISPVEQVQLLKKLYAGSLPFSQRNMDIVKRVMITESTPAYTIRSKTGWTMAGGINTGWWVGYLQKQGHVYFFATRLLQNRENNRADFSSCRKDITRAVLKSLHVLD